MENRIQQDEIQVKDSNWFALPFIGPLTYRISRFLRSNLKINLGYYTGRKLSTFFNNHKNQSKEKEFGIYKISCSACPKFYIGETERDIHTRLSEHINHCRNLNTAASALALHLQENENHFPDVKSLKLIDKEDKRDFRKIKESAYIKKHRSSTVNNSDGMKCHPVLISTITPLLRPI